MIKYAKIVNEQTGLCEVGEGTNIDFYKSVGMVEMDVSVSEVDKHWYLTEKLQTDEYEEQKRQSQIVKHNFNIQLQLDELDQKRVRALCEPQLKNAETGETWLEYYNNQIAELRSQMK